MQKTTKNGNKAKKRNAGIFVLLKPYKGMVVLLVLFALISNAANLVIPRIIAIGIDTFNAGNYEFKHILIQFIIAAATIFFFTFLQTIVQTYAAEKVGFDLRKKLSDKISRQSYAFIQKANPSKLLTNLTSDMDSLKMFVSTGLSSLFSLVFIFFWVFSSFLPFYKPLYRLWLLKK